MRRLCNYVGQCCSGRVSQTRKESSVPGSSISLAAPQAQREALSLRTSDKTGQGRDQYLGSYICRPVGIV